MYRLKINKPQTIGDLVAVIFDDYIVSAYVEMMTISKPAGYGDWQQLLEAIGKIDYNEFDGRKVSDWLCMRTAFNGGTIANIRFGREGSPVLYLTVTKAVHEPTGTDPHAYRKLTARERTRLARTLLKEAKDIMPNEAWIEPPGVVRLWWD
jgi:hypothetical protein